VHVLVLVALGVTATAPAHAVPVPADAGPGRTGATGASRGLVGLAVPDRVDAGRATPAVVRVRPGDSLWRVARRLLGEGADDEAVDRMWRLIARTNADRIGPDPDLIFPGTLLRVPETGRALGKDDR
jgi:nucleoid-associated protein YgaU